MYLGQNVFPVIQKNFGLLGIAQEHLKVERLREQLLAVLSHLVQLLPSIAQGFESLAQEQVLRVVGCRLFGCDVLAVVRHT